VGVEGADGGFVVVFSGGEADGRLVEPEILVLRVLSDVSLSLKGEDGVNGWDGEGWYASVSRRNEAEADIKARLTFGVKEGENLGELLLPRAMVVVPIVIMLVIMLVFLLSSLVIVSSLSGVLMVLLLAVRLSDKLRIVSGFLGNDGGRDLSVEDALDSDEGFFSDDFEFAVRKNGGGGKGIELRQIETRRRGGEEGSDGVKNGVERLEAEGVEMILEVKRYQRDQQLIQHRSTLQPVSARLHLISTISKDLPQLHDVLPLSNDLLRLPHAHLRRSLVLLEHAEQHLLVLERKLLERSPDALALGQSVPRFPSARSPCVGVLARIDGAVDLLEDLGREEDAGRGKADVGRGRRRRIRGGGRMRGGSPGRGGVRDVSVGLGG
jgi:hypothetical protein